MCRLARVKIPLGMAGKVAPAVVALDGVRPQRNLCHLLVEPLVPLAQVDQLIFDAGHLVLIEYFVDSPS
jgi:hypothetical protein